MQSRLAILLATVVCLASLTVSGSAKSKSSAFLGIVPGEITSNLAEDYGVKPGEGIIVEGVTGDSPADEMGLRENDVITAVNGSPVTGPEEFRHLLSKFKPKDSIELTYFRGGKSRTAPVTLSERETDRAFWAPRPEREGPFAFHFRNSEKDEDRGYAGLYLQELGDGLKSYFKVADGVLISEVVDDSPADKAGLKAGDVITSVAGEDVEDESDVRREIRSHKPGESLEFKIMRDGALQTITVTLGDREDSPGMGELQWEGMDGGSFSWDSHGEALEGLEDKLRDLKVHVDGGTINLDGLDDLDSKLQELEIRIEELPPMQLEMDPPSVPGPEIEIRKARPIWDRSVWIDTWEKIKSGVYQQMDAWESGMARLKRELHDLREEIMQRFA